MPYCVLSLLFVICTILNCDHIYLTGTNTKRKSHNIVSFKIFCKMYTSYNCNNMTWGNLRIVPINYYTLYTRK